MKYEIGKKNYIELSFAFLIFFQLLPLPYPSLVLNVLGTIKISTENCLRGG